MFRPAVTNEVQVYKMKNCKGFTVPELLLGLLVIGMISVLLTQLLSFNVSTSKEFALYINQQYTVQDAAARLNRDIEGAVYVSFDDHISGNQYETINLSVDGNTRKWNLSGGTLSLNGIAVLSGLTSDSCFIRESNTLTVVLKPVETNTGRNPINVTKPIVYQYSLEYK